MLKLGGYINILIAIGHIIGLFWANEMFEITGVGKEMAQHAEIHPSLPYLLTILASIFFLIFGLYGLSADNKFRKLPFLKFGIFVIAAIYIFRGLGELIFDTINKANTLKETIYSIVALAIGLLFLFGGLRKWKVITIKK